ncbi:MAG TPA: methyltransferase domain-containing protein [Ktedonobacteraceae bacterium]|nr:methyltransferase domain-containing protein [Ktedonobacteraceae bacterium]
METFAHHHHKKTNEAQTGSTQGWVMNMGWRYDLMVWLFDTFVLRGTLRRLPQRAADLAQLQPGEVVLDVGCGTGALAIEASRRIGATGQVCGIDPGPKQVIRARAKAEQARLPIDFQVGVIEQLAFPDHSFDVVLSTLVMHHLPDDLKRPGLAEMARVLRSGGRLVIVDFKRAEARSRQPTRLGAGSLGLQDLPALLQDAGFDHLESGEIAFPRVMGLEGAGFVRARKSL